MRFLRASYPNIASEDRLVAGHGKASSVRLTKDCCFHPRCPQSLDHCTQSSRLLKWSRRIIPQAGWQNDVSVCSTVVARYLTLPLKDRPWPGSLPSGDRNFPGPDACLPHALTVTKQAVEELKKRTFIILLVIGDLSIRLV